MKLKIAAITLALSSVSILGACASLPEAETTPEGITPESSLSVPEPPEELSESTEPKLDDPTSSEEPGVSVTDELSETDVDGTLELTAPEIEGENITGDADSVEDAEEPSTEEAQPLPEEDTQTSN